MDNEKFLLQVAAAAALSIFAVTQMHLNRNRNINKRKPVRQWLKRRRSKGLGVLEMLNKELAVEDESSYKNYLRMTQAQFNDLLNLIRGDIEKLDTLMQDTIPTKNRLEITLRFLATGESFRSLMYNTRVHESSISRFVPEVCQAIFERLKSNYVKTPTTTEEWIDISENFNSLWQFPNCLGALDGRHIKFKPPRSDRSYYYNYKGEHSIVLLALADAKYRFTYINLGCNGRISDGGVFQNSSLSKAMTTNILNFPSPKSLLGRTKPVPYVIIADDAFPLKENILKPYPLRGLSHDERIFNYRLSRARRIIENAFGILANRFRVLLSSINLRVTKVEQITLACIALHNYLATENASTYTDISSIGDIEELNKIPKQGGNKSADSARAVRTEFREYFCSELGSVNWQEDAINKFNM